MQGGVVDERPLASRVGLAGAPSEAMPEVERDVLGMVSLDIVPPRWWGLEVGCLLRYGAKENNLEYAKREAQSASAFDFDESQEEEKVKLSRAAIIRKSRRMLIVGMEWFVSSCTAKAMASLSM